MFENCRFSTVPLNSRMKYRQASDIESYSLCKSIWEISYAVSAP